MADNNSFSAYQINKVIPLRDRDYFHFLEAKLLGSRKRVWATIFFIDPSVKSDDALVVRSLLHSLARAVWRNVDVRILVGNSQAKNIYISNTIAVSTFAYFGIPARRFVGSEKTRSLHSKYVLIDDDLAIVGSHNWTPGAAGLYKEDSIATVSQELNLLLRDEFLSHWDRAKASEKEDD